MATVQLIRMLHAERLPFKQAVGEVAVQQTHVPRAREHPASLHKLAPPIIHILSIRRVE